MLEAIYLYTGLSVKFSKVEHLVPQNTQEYRCNHCDLYANGISTSATAGGPGLIHRFIKSRVPPVPRFWFPLQRARPAPAGALLRRFRRVRPPVARRESPRARLRLPVPLALPVRFRARFPLHASLSSAIWQLADYFPGKIPQGLKPTFIGDFIGTTEVVP